MMPTGSARARARSASQSARWNIWDRLGVGQRMVDKGVVWSVGKIFHGASQLYQFNLLPEEGHKRPAFINLQQFYAEAYLVDRVEELAGDRPALAQQGDRARAAQRPCGADDRDARRSLPDARELSSSPATAPVPRLRQMVGAEFAGQVFEDQFLIADVKMTAEFPTERWFWFDPPFHAGRSALLHKQPDDIWRIDLQLSRFADPASKSSRRMCGRASRACSATTSSNSNGSRSTNSSAGGWTGLSMAA